MLKLEQLLACPLSLLFTYSSLLLPFYLNLTTGAAITLVAGPAYAVSCGLKRSKS